MRSSAIGRRTGAVGYAQLRGDDAPAAGLSWPRGDEGSLAPPTMGRRCYGEPAGPASQLPTTENCDAGLPNAIIEV